MAAPSGLFSAMPLNITLFFTAILIWGSTWYAITFQLGAVDPSVSIGYRFLLAGSVLLGWLVLRRQPVWPARGTWQLIAGAGLLNFSLNYLLVYKATVLLPSGLVAVAGSALSLMNVLNARIFLKQPLRPAVLLGGCLGLSGVLMLFLPELDGGSLAGGALVGLGLMMLSNYSASLGNMVVSTARRAGMPLIVLTGWAMVIGAGLMLALAALRGADFAVSLTTPYLLSLLYLALFGSIAAFLCYFTLLSRIGADRAGYVSIMTPVVALVISTLFEGYHWTPIGLAGLVLALLGNLLVMAPPGFFTRQPAKRHA
jgi:drug/metabolite transporter (DMT)-like permease